MTKYKVLIDQLQCMADHWDVTSIDGQEEWGEPLDMSEEDATRMECANELRGMLRDFSTTASYADVEEKSELDKFVKSMWEYHDYLVDNIDQLEGRRTVEFLTQRLRSRLPSRPIDLDEYLDMDDALEGLIDGVYKRVQPMTSDPYSDDWCEWEPSHLIGGGGRFINDATAPPKEWPLCLDDLKTAWRGERK